MVAFLVDPPGNDFGILFAADAFRKHPDKKIKNTLDNCELLMASPILK